MVKDWMIWKMNNKTSTGQRCDVFLITDKLNNDIKVGILFKNWVSSMHYL